MASAIDRVKRRVRLHRAEDPLPFGQIGLHVDVLGASQAHDTRLDAGQRPQKSIAARDRAARDPCLHRVRDLQP